MARDPDFIIGGASKSGTTSLWRWLASHPRVAMPATKEIRYFERHQDRGLAWYREHFPDGELLTGEASPRYLTHPGVPERIATALPDVRLLFTLRDPVARAYSDYWMDRDRGRAPATFESALEIEELRSRYLGTGEYWRHLRRFEQTLGTPRIHVTFLDDMERDPERAFADACRFLDLEPVITEAVGSKVNQRVAFRSLAVRRVARRLPRSVRRVVDRANVRRVRYVPLDERTEVHLREHFHPHDERLADLLGRPLPWR